MLKKLPYGARTAPCALLALLLCTAAAAQGPGAKPGAAAQTGPVITQIDLKGLRDVLKPAGKPRLVNFWATWCDPCREEFPDLVKLDADYKGRIDIVTVSLDDPNDIKTIVPKFLREMKAEMPAFLLVTPDEDAAIAVVSRDWNGNLPLTMLYSETGDVAYMRSGKIKAAVVSAEIDKVLARPAAKSP